MNKNTNQNNESLASRFEWIREEAANAIDNMFKPIFAQPAIEVKVEEIKPINDDDALADIFMLWKLNDLSLYEKVVLTYLISSRVKSEATTSAQIAEATSISIPSIKRAVASLKTNGIVINHPSKPGFILNLTTII